MRTKVTVIIPAFNEQSRATAAEVLEKRLIVRAELINLYWIRHYPSGSSCDPLKRALSKSLV